MTTHNYCPSCGFKLGCNPEKKKRKPVNQGLRLKIFKRDGYRCVICKSDVNLQVDHKTPVSKGGTNDERNLQTLCWNCNVGKSDKLIAGKNNLSWID